MRLVTLLERMAPACRLYESLGFTVETEMVGRKTPRLMTVLTYEKHLH